MADTENVPPTSSSARQKPVVKSVKSKSVPSDRKKLQTLQPSGKNQKLLVSSEFCSMFDFIESSVKLNIYNFTSSDPLLAGWS